MAGEFPAVPLILDLKDPGPAHAVLGAPGFTLDFLREALGGQEVEVIAVKALDDLAVMSRLGLPGAFIFLLPAEQHLTLAPDTRRRLHIWSTRPIKKHTAAIRSRKAEQQQTEVPAQQEGGGTAGNLADKEPEAVNTVMEVAQRVVLGGRPGIA
jgi:hypothetical protein